MRRRSRWTGDAGEVRQRRIATAMCVLLALVTGALCCAWPLRDRLWTADVNAALLWAQVSGVALVGALAWRLLGLPLARWSTMAAPRAPALRALADDLDGGRVVESRSLCHVFGELHGAPVEVSAWVDAEHLPDEDLLELRVRTSRAPAWRVTWLPAHHPPGAVATYGPKRPPLDDDVGTRLRGLVHHGRTRVEVDARGLVVRVSAHRGTFEPGRLRWLLGEAVEVARGLRLPLRSAWEPAVEVSPIAASDGVTCPFCREAVGADAWSCGACRTAHHRECFEEHGGCTVLGCRDAPGRRERA